MADWSPGVTIRKYRIEARLGEGATSVVYAATHVNNGLRVALKVLHGELAQETDIKTRFLREGYAANSIQHPGVARVLDDDTLEDGTVFLVMDLLDGESLTGRAARYGGALPVQEMLPITDRLLDVLGAAHDQGIVHRDIKPDNVFLTRDGAIKVLDFGLARMKQNAEKFMLETTGAGVVMGTLDFMSPEQARGDNAAVDARSDLWSVGATMFTMLSGKRVHSGKSMADYLYATATEVPKTVAFHAPHLPPHVVAIVDRAVALDQNARFQSAREMQEVIRRAYYG
ncbi:MAG: serine/threonine-protein kinase [Polyangiaceae bacterium]